MATGNAMTEPYGREGLPLDEARAQILGALRPLQLTETLALAEALGRTTATAVLAAAAWGRRGSWIQPPWTTCLTAWTSSRSRAFLRR